jgi:hypothetical protein
MADIVLNRATHIEFPDNPEIDMSNAAIESGSLLLEEILCEKDIVFGETNATRFEATVYNLTDVSRLKIKVYQTDIYGNNRKNLFEGYVDSCKQDKDGYYRKLVAYDAIYSIGNANVAGWWFHFWSSRETATIKELRESLCDWAGIRCDTSINLYNDGFICSKTATLSSVSFNTMLSWICEIQCTIPHIDRDGILRFIVLSNSYYNDIGDLYERSSSEFEGFVTATIDTVELYDYDNNLVATTNSTGAVVSKNTYVIKDNALLFSLVDTLTNASATDFVLGYLAQIRRISYTPCKLNMIVSDLDLLVGDFIQAGQLTSVILQNTLSGNLLVDQEIRASGNEYLQDSSKTATAEYLSLEKKTDSIKDEIITDDLLSYSHTNKEAYTLESVVTPIINVAINMPKTSNLVFLATINLETVSTETREVREVVMIDGKECEIVRTEKMPVIVEGFFEWNGAQILSNKPTETYSEDGKHLMNLMFFSIGGRQAGDISTFKVFLAVKHGRVLIGENQVNATIISKGSSAGNLPWDGTITIDESIKPIIVGKRKTALGNILDTATAVFNTPTESPDDVEIIGEIAVKARTIRIDGISDSVETSTSS